MGEERQKLKHGKALCGKVFAKFVETFNWLVDFGTNLKGDADVNGKQGYIRVDRTDPKHPIIRFVGNKKAGSGAGGSDPEDPEEEGEEGVEGVTSLNGLTGAVEIVAGNGIRIEVDGKQIKIIADENAKDSDDQTDPCDHPEGGEGSGGGVIAGGGGGGPGGRGDDGGVPADDGTNHGNACTSEDCNS